MLRSAVHHCIFINIFIFVLCDHLSKKKLPHILSASNGAPVDMRELKTLNMSLIDNDYFLETASHFVRENIPDRVVHTKGAGAFGYFHLTNNISHICSAKLFSTKSKAVPVAARFSLPYSEKGSPDTTRGPRGFSVRFFTEDGNFDIVGLNVPVFMIKDPILYPSVVHSHKRNPSSNLYDDNMAWDFISLHPESLHFTLLTYLDDAVLNGYRKMPGFGIHTYQVYNNRGEIHFIKFHIVPDTDLRNIYHEQTTYASRKDPDFASKDLHDSIESDDFPSWHLKVQILTMQDVKESRFDVFDVTRTLPEEAFPLHTVGKITLLKNPKNYFAEIEQMAFNPANLVPGILGAPDKMFEARKLIYRDALNYRLGVNYNNIRTNCPLKPPTSYLRDGKPPLLYNGLNQPNYLPNSFNGPVPVMDSSRPKLVPVRLSPAYNHDQCSDLYTSLSDEQKSRLIEDLVLDLREVVSSIQRRVVNHLSAINEDLAKRIAELLSYG